MAQTGFIGEIRLFAGNFAPRTWAFCEGQLLSIAQNTALFSILGTIYGGDGRTTFALPDLRGRGPISSGTGPGLPTYRQGSRSGTVENFLNILQIPAHNHVVQVGVSAEAAEEAVAGHLAAAAIYNEDATTGSILQGVSMGLTGNGQPINNQQPYLGVYYIIALQGTFPSRN